METSWVIGLIAICDEFEYKVVHTYCYLFGKCFRKTSKDFKRYFLHLIKAAKNQKVLAQK